jgi:hypothetical protein
MKNHWMNELDERQQKELLFARLYAKDFAHGTDGHHRLLLIAKLAALLDEYLAEIEPKPEVTPGFKPGPWS